MSVLWVFALVFLICKDHSCPYSWLFFWTHGYKLKTNVPLPNNHCAISCLLLLLWILHLCCSFLFHLPLNVLFYLIHFQFAIAHLQITFLLPCLYMLGYINWENVWSLHHLLLSLLFPPEILISCRLCLIPSELQNHFHYF